MSLMHAKEQDSSRAAASMRSDVSPGCLAKTLDNLGHPNLMSSVENVPVFNLLRPALS